MFITRKKLHNLLKEAYEQGLTKGCDLAWQMRQVGYNSKLNQELEEIVKRKR